LPGTNHAILFNGKPSLDVHRQQCYVETIVNNSITASEGSGHYYASPANVSPDLLLTAEPYCFVADTDSFPFLINTGANRFIVNSWSLFTSFKPQSGLVKGIGGTPVPLSGIGTIEALFDLTGSEQFVDDPVIALNRRKQQRLATYHEQLGHVSFSRLQLIAKTGLIPKDLANIKPPVCPGCAYGKAH
jgi:hypothetical protein